MPISAGHQEGRIALALLAGIAGAGCLSIVGENRDSSTSGGQETTGQAGASPTTGGQTSGGQTSGGRTTAGRATGETSGGSTGGVGDPQIYCTPPAIAFGKTADHSITSVPVLCTNTGTGTNLVIEPPTATPAVFSAQFDETNGPYPLNGLAPGQAAQIDVSYAPVASSSDMGTLLIKSNSGQGQTLQIPLTGQGLDIPPCQFVIAPSQLNFGDGMVGSTSQSLSLEVQNVGIAVCFVVGLGSLSDGFAVVSTSIAPDPTTGKITIPPPGTGIVSNLIIEVDLTCTAAGPVSTQFTIGGQTCLLSGTCG
jgi:hypothetical protein